MNKPEIEIKAKLNIEELLTLHSCLLQKRRRLMARNGKETRRSECITQVVLKLMPDIYEMWNAGNESEN